MLTVVHLNMAIAKNRIAHSRSSEVGPVIFDGSQRRIAYSRRHRFGTVPGVWDVAFRWTHTDRRTASRFQAFFTVAAANRKCSSRPISRVSDPLCKQSAFTKSSDTKNYGPVVSVYIIFTVPSKSLNNNVHFKTINCIVYIMAKQPVRLKYRRSTPSKLIKWRWLWMIRVGANVNGKLLLESSAWEHFQLHLFTSVINFLKNLVSTNHNL